MPPLRPTRNGQGSEFYYSKSESEVDDSTAAVTTLTNLSHTHTASFGCYSSSIGPVGLTALRARQNRVEIPTGVSQSHRNYYRRGR